MQQFVDNATQYVMLCVFRSFFHPSITHGLAVHSNQLPSPLCPECQKSTWPSQLTSSLYLPKYNFKNSHGSDIQFERSFQYLAVFLLTEKVVYTKYRVGYFGCKGVDQYLSIKHNTCTPDLTTSFVGSRTNLFQRDC